MECQQLQLYTVQPRSEKRGGVPLLPVMPAPAVIIRGKKGKGSPYSITERRVPELVPVFGSQPAGDVSHKPGGRLPLLSARQLPPQPLIGLLPILLLGEQRHNGREQFEPGPSAPESSTLTTRLPSHI